MAAGKGTPGKLLDYIKDAHGLKNDAALARYLDIGPPAISKIQRGNLQISPALILSIHEITGLPVAQIRELIAA